MFRCRKLAGVGIEQLITLRRASIENQCLLAHFLARRNFGEKKQHILEEPQFSRQGWICSYALRRGPSYIMYRLLLGSLGNRLIAVMQQQACEYGASDNVTQSDRDLVPE